MQRALLSLAIVFVSAQLTHALVDVDERPAFPTLQGKLLVAADDMDDPYFAGSRLYVVLHDEGGAVAVRLNRTPEMRLSIPIYEGGPVGTDRLIVLADAASQGSVRVEDQVYATLDDEVVHALIDGKGPQRAKVFLGYAGWAPGQLERELREGAWRVDDVDAPFVFAPVYE